MITVIVPNWNGERYLRDLLPDLAAQTLPARRVLLVDNGSSDSSIAAARGHGADVLALPANRGFAYAVNRGVEAARTELVAVLNNDMRLDSHWLEHCACALLADPSLAFATGKIYQLRKEALLDGAFDLLCRGGTAWRAGSGRPDSPLWNQPRQIRFPPFTAVLLRRALFDEIGPLDESFESYLEDVDFGLRCALAGRCGAYVPDAVSRHWGSATLGLWRHETVRLIARNQVFLVAKHYPRLWQLEYGWPVLAAHLLYGFLAFRHGAGLGFLRGKLEGILGYDRHCGAGAEPDRFRSIIRDSEDLLRHLQQHTGFDRYWKLYFALTARANRT